MHYGEGREGGNLVGSLGLVLFSSPYGHQDADHMVRIAERAVEKGYKVNIFLYGDGIHAQMRDQTPAAFLNIGAKLEELASKGVTIGSCQRCSKARGYVDGEYSEEKGSWDSSRSIDSVSISSLHGLADLIADSDRVMIFGGAW